MASIHEQILLAVKAAVVAADLPGIPASRIHVQAVPDRSNLEYPCVLIALDGMRETLEPYSTEEDARTLPVQVHVLDRQSAMSSAAWLPAWLSLREGIADAFLAKVTGVAGNWVCPVRPAEIVDAQRILGPQFECCAGGLVLEPQVITARIAPG